jgi:tRNA 2-thiouridine synthesizing protein E
MPDINKFIENEGFSSADPEGRLLELAPWSEEIANSVATAEDLMLTDEHWEVVRFLRSYFAEHGPAPNARTVLQALEGKIAGGKKRLYQLFPMGPVSQGSRIAGIPVPAHGTDPGFGTVE